jgi:hypothetical protein
VTTPGAARARIPNPLATNGDALNNAAAVNTDPGSTSSSDLESE